MSTTDRTFSEMDATVDRLHAVLNEVGAVLPTRGDGDPDMDALWTFLTFLQTKMRSRAPLITMTTPAANMASMILPRVPFVSLDRTCLLPYTGLATLGYVPKKGAITRLDLRTMLAHHANVPGTPDELADAVSANLKELLDPQATHVIVEASLLTAFVPEHAMVLPMRSTAIYEEYRGHDPFFSEVLQASHD